MVASPGSRLDKKKLSEADICEKFISPALQQAGWDAVEHVYREYTLRPGHVVVRGRQAARDKRAVLRADYVLFYKTNIPLAEQSRIVARVVSLRRLCADLRHSLAAGQTAQAKLAESLVAEVL